MTQLDLAAFADTDAAALVVDRDGVILAASTSAIALLHCERNIVSTPLAAFLRDQPPDHDWTAGAVTVLVGCDQSVVTVRPSIVALDGPPGARLVLLHDITTEQRQIAELTYRAEHDAASRLHNRQFAVDAIGRLLDSGEPVTLIAIELRRFDGDVSPLGDQNSATLVSAAARRIDEIADADDLIARIGPTHLLLARPGRGQAEDALDLCVDIVDTIGTTLELHGISFPTAAVCGAAIGRPGESAELAAHDASLALRQALTDQIDMAFLSEPLRDSDRRRLTVEQALTRAVASRALELYIQPVVNASDGRLAGYEGLSRWHHPVLGIVSPLEFIPLAERAGLMHAIGELSLASALQILARWRDAGVPCVPIALNLSPTQLLDRKFASSMIDAVAEQGAQGLIAVEVKESLLPSDRAVELLTMLESGGIVIGVDGYGTGSSALAYLADLPWTFIKIDRRFVARLGHPRTLSLVRSAINMAHALEMRAIAEGVETKDEADTLAAIGCDGIQGYYVGPPEPALAAHRYDVGGS